MNNSQAVTFSVELTPHDRDSESEREKCDTCEYFFHPSELRIKKTKRSRTVKTKHIHFMCFVVKLGDYEFHSSGEKLKGFPALSQPHQNAIAKALPPLNIDSSCDSDTDASVSKTSKSKTTNDSSCESDDSKSLSTRTTSRTTKTPRKSPTCRVSAMTLAVTGLEQVARVYKREGVAYDVGLKLIGPNDEKKVFFCIQLLQSTKNSAEKCFWISTSHGKNENEVVFRTVKYAKAEAATARDKFFNLCRGFFEAMSNLPSSTLNHKKDKKKRRQNQKMSSEDSSDSDGNSSNDSQQNKNITEKRKIKVDQRSNLGEVARVYTLEKTTFSTELKLVDYSNVEVFSFKIQVLISRKHATEKEFWVFCSSNTLRRRKDTNLRTTSVSSAAEALKLYEQLGIEKMSELSLIVKSKWEEFASRTKTDKDEQNNASTSSVVRRNLSINESYDSSSMSIDDDVIRKERKWKGERYDDPA